MEGISTILIVGLGNPGDKYEKTRHNAGFLALNTLAKKLNVTFKEDSERHAQIAEMNNGETKVILAKPQSFMNNSGEPVRALAEHFHVPVKNIWIVTDDVALPLGTLRIRSAGSAGGHNGLKSVIEHLNTELFPRFKIGVDAPPTNVPLEAWVVSRFSSDELIMLKEVIEQTVEAITDALHDGIDPYTSNV